MTAEIGSSNSAQVNALKEKQSTTNSIKILQTKLEAAEIEKKYFTSKITQLENELVGVRKELKEITQKYHEKEIGVQEIYKDE